MRPFEGFKRRAVIVVVGDEEQAKRRALQEAEDGKDVPDTAVLEMKGMSHHTSVITVSIFCFELFCLLFPFPQPKFNNSQFFLIICFCTRKI